LESKKGRFGVLFLLEQNTSIDTSVVSMTNHSVDTLILSFDRMAKTLSGAARAQRAQPTASVVASSGRTLSKSSTARPDESLDADERDKSISLMRVNHAGEVAAQALYEGQALFSRDPALREKLKVAADEEIDHLVWTRERIHALGGHTSVLDPLWYAGAFAIGAAAAAIGDKASLAFLEATETQVEAHLDSHLSQLPAEDKASRAIVEQMKADEAKHAQTARELGAPILPLFAQSLMRASAKVMTTLAAKI
jgi:3-demethoxyubiquinol 3-hydroxylase